MGLARSRRNRLFRAVPACFGAAAAVVYLLFALLAYIRYPAVFSIQNDNWLSDLGNRGLNPGGADFYVWGCIATGTLLLAFFLSLTVWRKSGSRIQNWLLAFVQIAGGMAALSLVMSAIYTEDQFTKHQFWSRLIYAGFAMALFAAPFAFRRRGYRSIALIATAVIGYCSILASLIFSGAHWLEWPSVGLILVFVCLLGWMSLSRSTAGLREGEPRRPRVLRPSP
jgi:peptidoglycan/LPS O-acetylase OafA/YrhL